MTSGVIEIKLVSSYFSNVAGSVEIPFADKKVNKVRSFWATRSDNRGNINDDAG